MQLSTALSIATLLPLSFASPLTTHEVRNPAPSLPFHLKYIFTATLNFGPPAIEPVPLLGSCGVGIPVPVVNGTVHGPGIQGVILGGTGQADLYSNQTIRIPHVTAYGKLDAASEGAGFFTVTEQGISTEEVHATRLVGDVPRFLWRWKDSCLI
jgi:hypothetical protein